MNANYLVHLIFLNFDKNRLIYTGFRKNIDENHVWELDDENRTEVLGEELEKKWENLLKKANSKKSFSFFNLFNKKKVHDELEMVSKFKSFFIG